MLHRVCRVVSTLTILALMALLIINFVKALQSSFYGQVAIIHMHTKPETAFWAAKRSFELRHKEHTNANRLGNISEVMFFRTKNKDYLDMAVKAYAWAVKDEPQEALNRYLMGVALLQVNQTAFSNGQFDIAIKLEPSNPVYLKRGAR